MDCPAVSRICHLSGIIHRCFCRLWRSPIALKLISSLAGLLSLDSIATLLVLLTCRPFRTLRSGWPVPRVEHNVMKMSPEGAEEAALGTNFFLAVDRSGCENAHRLLSL
jgi:hypothetical protein